MKRKILITESDKYNILSMYGLLNEDDKGSFVISVTDLNKKPVEVLVIITNIQTGKEQQGVTDKTGNLTVDNLEFGTYSLELGGRYKGKGIEQVKPITKENPRVSVDFKDVSTTFKEVTVYITANIFGKIVTKINEQDIPVPNVEIKLTYEEQKGLFSKRKNLDVKVKELPPIESKTNENGEFYFEKVKTYLYTNINVDIDGGDIFYDKKIVIEKTVSDTDLGTIYLERLPVEEPPKPFEPVVVKNTSCEGYESTKKVFYGYGYAKNEPISNEFEIFDDTISIKTAKRHAVKQYLLMYPSNGVTINEILEKPIKYKLECSNVSTDFVNPVTTNVIKVTKKELDSIVQKILDEKNKVVTERIDFQYLDFKPAILSSLNSGKPLFVFFGSVEDENSNDVVKYIESNQELTKRLNKNYIPIYYEVDTKDKEGYVIAADSLSNVDYPSFAIIQGTANPNEKQIRDTFKVINLETYIASNLPLIDKLIQ